MIHELIRNATRPMYSVASARSAEANFSNFFVNSKDNFVKNVDNPNMLIVNNWIIMNMYVVSMVIVNIWIIMNMYVVRMFIVNIWIIMNMYVVSMLIVSIW